MIIMIVMMTSLCITYVYIGLLSEYGIMRLDQGSNASGYAINLYTAGEITVRAERRKEKNNIKRDTHTVAACLHCH